MMNAHEIAAAAARLGLAPAFNVEEANAAEGVDALIEFTNGAAIQPHSDTLTVVHHAWGEDLFLTIAEALEFCRTYNDAAFAEQAEARRANGTVRHF